MTSGAKPGERRGGRKKGVPNKLTKESRAYLDQRGLSPLKVLADNLETAIQDGDLLLQIKLALELMPYYAPKLKALEVETKKSEHKILEIVSDGKVIDRFVEIAENTEYEPPILVNP